MSKNQQDINIDMANLHSQLQAIDVKIDSFHRTTSESINRIEQQTKKTNGRVGTLEKWMWGVVGGGSVFVLLPALQEILKSLTK